MHEIPGREVASEEAVVPSIQRKQVGDHSESELVAFTRRAPQEQPWAALRPLEQRVERGDGRLRRARGQMLIGDRDAVRQPEPAHLYEGRAG